MGLFSFLSKKNGSPEGAGNTLARTGESTRLTPAETEAERARQREISRVTAAKIDAIELEMSSDIFNQPEPAWGHPPAQRVLQSTGATLTLGEPSGLHSVFLNAPEAAVAPASAPVEESAILYANGEDVATEALLTESLAGEGRTERRIWWMLFDLYQAQGREEAFNSIAIDYASAFETSPPAYHKRSNGNAGAGVAPTAALSGTLDEDSAPQLARLLAAPADGAVLRIELGQIRAVTEVGCSRLLATLQALRKRKRALVVAGGDTLVSLLRPALVVGDPSSGQPPWLLMIELLQLLHREKEFEEAAMDYCVTFEVSPPSFEPAPNVASAAPASGSTASGDQFVLPAVISGNCAPLMAAIGTFAATNSPAVLDCARLTRIDYGCAAILVEKLRSLQQDKVQVELRDLSHLVTELLRLLGGGECARLFPHRY